MKRGWQISLWADTCNVIVPPIFESEVLAEVEAEWPKMIAKYPDRLLTFSKGYVMYKHPDTDWVNKPAEKMPVHGTARDASKPSLDRGK